MSLTLKEAKALFEVGDLASISLLRPAGAAMSQIFIDCISIAQGSELDSMIEKCLLLKRGGAFYMWGSNLPSETDNAYRQRAETYAYILDQNDKENSILSAGTPPPPPCSHSWKVYQGLFERDEYCTRCNKKRPI